MLETVVFDMSMLAIMAVSTAMFFRAFRYCDWRLYSMLAVACPMFFTSVLLLH